MELFLAITYNPQHLQGFQISMCLLFPKTCAPIRRVWYCFGPVTASLAALGISILGLEMGFLLAYRAGWDISLAGIVSASAVAVVLIPVGLLAFKERLSLFNIFGVVLCIAGLVMVNYKN